MTVSAQITINEYIANGVVIIFPYTFKVVIATDLKVFIDDVLTTTGFEVNGIGEENGGDITFITEEPPVNGTKIRLERHVPFERSFDYLTGGPLDANTLDNDVDRIVMMVQDLGTQTTQTYENFSESINAQIDVLENDINVFETNVNASVTTMTNNMNTVMDQLYWVEANQFDIIDGGFF